MSKNKQFVEKVTAMEDDFPQWYTDVVKQAELVDYGPVRGTMIIEPYGFALWENIRDELDRQIKATGHSNVSFPLFIPERSEEHTSELQSRFDLVCRLLLEKKKLVIYIMVLC